jgi:hypothetical protein
MALCTNIGVQLRVLRLSSFPVNPKLTGSKPLKNHLSRKNAEAETKSWTIEKNLIPGVAYYQGCQVVSFHTKKF